MSSVFFKIYNWLKPRKAISILLFVGVFALLAFIATRLQFEEDITKLIPSSERSDITNKVLKQVNFADKIVVYLETKNDGNEDDLTEYATEFVDSLNATCGTYIKEIQGKVNDEEIGTTLDFIYNNIPLFLDASDYKTIADKLPKDSIAQLTQANYKTLVSPTGVFARQTILRDPLGLSFMGLKKLQKLQVDDNFKIHNSFLVTKDNKNLLLFIKPNSASNETADNTKFVENLYQIQENLNTKFKDKVGSEYFGSTVIAVANAKQIKHDIQFTVSIAMTILLLILIFFYKKVLIPLILFTPTILGGLVAVAFLFFLKGKISAISLGIGSVLLGITLDYSLHILTHFKKNNDVAQLFKDVAKPILMSSLTTAIAFLCLIFLKSEALQDLGVFAAFSVLFSSLFALVFIPLVYRASKKKHTSKSTFLEVFSAYNFDKSKLLIGLIALITVVSMFTYKKVYFDNDISKLNFTTKALRTTEQKLDKLTNTNSKSIYTVAYGTSMQDALVANDTITQVLEELKSNKDILSFSSIGALVLSEKTQKEKIDRWNQFWQQHNKATLQQNLIKSGTLLGLKPKTFNKFYNHLNTDFSSVSVDDYKGLKTFFVDEFIASKEDLSTVTSLLKVSDENYQKVINKLNAQNNLVVIDRKNMNETFLGNLKNDFNSLIGYSLIAVVLILLLFFRNVELTLITIIPIALTWFITVGVMGLLNVKFNIFNIIISTFIFGLGVDYSIFITNGLIKQYKYGVKELKTYKTSILLSVITTILGVGVLIFAKHPALKSISIVSIIGILSAMLIAFTIQPLLFRFFVSGRTQKGLAPLRTRTFLQSLLLMTFYGLGGMILSLISIVILPLIPISKKKKFKWLHSTMAKMVTATLYGNPFVKKQVINPHNEDFTKPAIIISNHSSSLDTLTIGMVTSNIIYLVNDWVYKSPVFGLLARVTGFYPVSSGVDGSVDHLKEKVKQGYCLVVFPEAKRSYTNKLGRFHKGAFFLASELELDILPLYLHGNAEVMPKGDFIIHDGSLIVKIGQRIKYEELSNYGKTNREITKAMSSFYKNEFHKVRNELEHADYFKDILLSNYHYKGFDLLSKVKDDFTKNREVYKFLNEELPLKAEIAHITDNYGQLDILLVSKSLDRKIVTFIINKEKRTIAKNCYTSQNRKVNYVDDVKQVVNPKTSMLLIATKNQQIIKELKESLFLQIDQVIVLDNNEVVHYFTESEKFKIESKKLNVTFLKRNS